MPNLYVYVYRCIDESQQTPVVSHPTSRTVKESVHDR